jgi:hypothetical protein
VAFTVKIIYNFFLRKITFQKATVGGQICGNNMTNKYLEKIAARLKATETMKNGLDFYQAHKAVKKPKKKSKLEPATRKWNRGIVRKNV